MSHCTEHRHFAYRVHDMYVLSTGRRIERKTCIRITRMIEPTRAREYSSTSIHLHAIRLENADQTRFLACPRGVLLLDSRAFLWEDGFVDAAGPAFGILAVAGVESVVLPDLSTIKPSKLGTPAWLDCWVPLLQLSLIGLVG